MATTRAEKDVPADGHTASNSSGQDLRNRLSRPAVVPVEVPDVHGAILGMTKMLGTLAKDVRRAIPSTHQKPPQPHGTQVPTNHPAVEVEVTSPAPSQKNGERREGRGIPVSSNQPARSEASVFSRLGDRRRSAKDRLGRSHYVDKERDTQNHRGRHDHGEEERVQAPKVTHMTTSHRSLGHMTEHVGGTEIRSQKPRNIEVEDGGRKRVTIQADRTKSDLNDVEVRKLWRKIEDLQRRVDAGDGNTDAKLKTVTPFTTRIMAYPLPIGFKAPHVKAYSGTSDPQEHLSRYYANMIMIGASEEIICRCFLATLEGTACEWFNSLPHGSIDEWEDLAQRFLQHFAASKRTKQHYSHLLTVKQKKGEDLKDFVIRWRKESSAVHGADDQTRLAMFQAALRAGEFASSLIRDPPRSYQAALQRADRYADAEIREVQKKKDESSEPWREGTVPHHKKQKKNKKDFNYGPRQIPNTSSMPLTHPVGTILDYAERTGLMQGPRPEGEVYAVSGAKKYCRYHRVDNHDTEECFTLKREIERLIQRGHLSNFVKGAAQQPNHVWRKSSEQVACTQPETRRAEKRHIGNESDEDASDEPGPKRDKRNHDINFIYGGNAGGDSSSLRKKWARQLYIGEIMHSPMKKKVRREPICFTDDDLPPCPSPHRDAMVIKMEINDLVIHRTLVDTGSSVNIMYLDTFEKLKLSKGKLHPIKTPLSGFTGDSIEAEGVVTVPVEVGDTSHKVKLNMEFVVVRLTCAHNLILGRPGLEDLQCIVSPAHLCIKFPTPTGVGIARGSQKLARTCYIKITKKVGRHGLQVNTVATQYLQDEERRPRAEPAEGTEEVTLDPATPERKVKIGTGLSAELRAEVITVLTMYQGIFARGPEDMPGISRDVISHRLDVDTMSKPVKQKKRYMSSDRREFVRKEVGTLLKIGHIKEVKYPEWLANVVLAPKPPTWRMCVDYTDLNKACPMDPFPLPNIDQLVDETAGCELMSFMDAFSGYHQIRMHEEDAEKTSFMTPEGVFCYLVMAFGLKNSGATYTRMISKLFRPVLGRTMEAYVDDMIVKSKRAGTHAVDLAEVFKIMEKFNLRLNPKKCTFAVQGGKFLGYLVSRRGIEPNPEKIKAILEMEPPRNVKEVQRLTGRLAALNRFLSKLAEKATPFFHIMKKSKGFVWTEECQKSFEGLKNYLLSPPVLSKPEAGETLYLYLGVSPSAISSVLVREDGGVQRPVYYVSKTLRDAELRYTTIEKTVLSVVWTVKRLTQYFQAHPVHVLSHQPLGALMRSPTASSRMIKWAVYLSQFHIEVKPRPSIKGQALADFIVECTAREEATKMKHGDDEQEWWILSTDGSSAAKSCGGGVVLTTPEGFRAYYAIRFNFKVSNNEAEYEALLCGLRLAANMRAEKVKIRCDSKLVVGQITTEFEAKEERMRLYRDAALELLKLFIAYEIEQIPRAQNVEADMLSKLSAETPERISKIARIEELDTSSIYACPVQAITTRDADWIDCLIKYINEGVLPAEEVEAKVTKMRAPSYTILNEKLYKRSYNGTLLKCLRPDEAKVAMEEIHAGICSAHQGAHTMSRKVILQGFFWPTIVKDCAEFVKRCVVCQEFQKSPGRPATNYTPISTAIPFARWGIDLIGALPRGTGSVRWVIVAIDYFTKWIEAVPLASITEGQCRKFVMKHILCRFGVPQQIITDNGRQFGASGFNEFCESWGIKHSNASVAYPQANGQVENANRTIMDGLKKKLEAAGGEWAEELPQILWAYRTTPRKATGETPFALTYGFEARAPAEVILHSRREEEYDPETNEEVMATELLFIEERREAAFCRAENYRRQVKGYHDSRVRKRNFEVGDYVLRKREVSKPLEGGKFAKNYEGPYVIKSVIRPGTFKLQTPKGKEIERTWNAEHLLKFYH
ncbi:unnamed protein product [Cuscuta epithymum]|uniref:Uncharacterized protein n=1 Tax=Cuscuta epithymum TaxID=186058 RepID=A0AAV0G7W2_9ASTE|nr:unnamed protein product [Cuscuta epithymum]